MYNIQNNYGHEKSFRTPYLRLVVIVGTHVPPVKLSFNIFNWEKTQGFF